MPEEAALAALVAVDRAQDTPEALLAWVADMEELVGNQRPPSAEAKVAKAQLEEQKVQRCRSRGAAGAVPWRCGVVQGVFVAVVTAPCPAALQLLQRLLEERRSRVELMLQDRSGVLVRDTGTGTLGERWEWLVQEAGARWVRPGCEGGPSPLGLRWHRL